MPSISVIMATYNTPNEWLKESINSILMQTYSDFEFIIVDDCSTTDLNQIKRECDDERITWIRNEENIGLTKSLNKALKFASGKYIARMDADDISLPERFETQVKFMDSHREVIVCGSWRQAFGTINDIESWNLPKTREEQQVQLLFANIGLTHPTAMFRKSMLDRYGITYNERYRKAQDYGIWVQCTRYAPMAMIPQILLLYRKSPGQITANVNSVCSYADMIRIDQIETVYSECSESESVVFSKFCKYEYIDNISEIIELLTKIKNKNLTACYFDQTELIKVMGRRWYEYCKLQYLNNRHSEYKKPFCSSMTIAYILRDIELALKKYCKMVIYKFK